MIVRTSVHLLDDPRSTKYNFGVRKGDTIHLYSNNRKCLETTPDKVSPGVVSSAGAFLDYMSQISRESYGL